MKQYKLELKKNDDKITHAIRLKIKKKPSEYYKENKLVLMIESRSTKLNNSSISAKCFH